MGQLGRFDGDLLPAELFEDLFLLVVDYALK